MKKSLAVLCLAAALFAAPAFAEDPPSAPPADLVLKAEKGDAAAQRDLGLFYFKNFRAQPPGGKSNGEYAHELLMKSARQGDVIAQLNAGLDFCGSRGVGQDIAACVAWLEKAAAAGNAEAQRHLGVLLLDGKTGQVKTAIVEKDETKALDLFHKAAAQGDARAMYYIGLMYGRRPGGLAHKDKDGKTAFDWYRMAAEKGDSDAQAEMGDAYDPEAVPGSVPVARDAAKAVEWYEKAGAQGHIRAALLVAHMYLDGRGVKQDYAQAQKWFREVDSVDIGIVDGAQIYVDAVVDAKLHIGLMYQKGLGVEKDQREALRWFRRAAAFWSPDALYLLGQAYETGDGVPQDNVQGWALYKLSALDCCTFPLEVYVTAAETSHETVPGRDGNRKAEELAAKMSPADLARAEETFKADERTLYQIDNAHSWYYR